MNILGKRLFILLTAFMLESMAYPPGSVATTFPADYSIIPSSNILQTTPPVPLQKNTLYLRFHHGINETSLYFLKQYKGQFKYLHCTDNTFKSSYKRSYILTLRKDIPGDTFLSPPCFFRAPPFN